MLGEGIVIVCSLGVFKIFFYETWIDRALSLVHFINTYFDKININSSWKYLVEHKYNVLKNLTLKNSIAVVNLSSIGPNAHYYMKNE